MVGSKKTRSKACRYGLFTLMMLVMWISKRYTAPSWKDSLFC